MTWPGTAARVERRTLKLGHVGCHVVVPSNTIAAMGVTGVTTNGPRLLRW